MAAVREDMGEVPEVHIRPMMDLDLTEVSAIEQKSYAFPWSENIFRDCLRVGYTCRALDLAGQPPAASTRPSSRSAPATWRQSVSTNDSDSNKLVSGAGITRPPMGAKTPLS